MVKRVVPPRREAAPVAFKGPVTVERMAALIPECVLCHRPLTWSRLTVYSYKGASYEAVTTRCACGFSAAWDEPDDYSDVLGVGA